MVGEGPAGIAEGHGCFDHCTVHRAAPRANCPVQTSSARLKSPKLDDHFGISHINLMLSQQLSYIKKGPQVKKYKWVKNIYKYQPLYRWIYYCKRTCLSFQILCVCVFFYQIFTEALLSPPSDPGTVYSIEPNKTPVSVVPPQRNIWDFSIVSGIIYVCFNLISFSHKVCKNVSQVQNKAKRFSQPLFWCFFLRDYLSKLKNGMKDWRKRC